MDPGILIIFSLLMKKIRLPQIMESARKRPLSIDPMTGEFVYYENVANGKQKIFPIGKLSPEQLLRLVAERQLSAEEDTTVILNGRYFSNEQLAREILSQTEIGMQIYDADISYLNFYLSQFPAESFEQ